VAAITIANGSDNIGIYVPLFANSSWVGLIAIVGVFLLLVGVWCYAADKLTQQPAIANLMSRYGNTAVPFILIGLGAFIVLDSQALSLFALIASCLCLAGLVKKRETPVTTEAVVTSHIKQDRLIS
jgi:cadmium resistance protein CadD (predicted permease)